MIKKCTIGWKLGGLILVPVFFAVIALGIGAYPVTPVDIIKILIYNSMGIVSDVDAMASNLILTVRLPRILGCVLVGAGLAMTGGVFQGIFRNPLASPYTLGVSNGAAFGAAMGIILSLNSSNIQILALAFGLLAMMITFLVARTSKQSTVVLVLSGLLVGSLFASLIALTKFMADPFEKLPQIIFWLMGTMSGISYEKIITILPLYLISIIILYFFSWKINVLSMGDEQAKAYGLDVKRDRIIIVICASIVTATIVSVTGIIGWVGIVIPHLARQLVGPDARKLLPASMSLGICYLVAMDTLCRSITASEIPLGVVTGIVGAPLFIYFIYQKKVRW